MDKHYAEDLVRGILLAIGDDPQREGLKDTPRRVVEAWKELYCGYSQSPAQILSDVFEEGAYDAMVLLKNISFSSICEHHMLPFIGVTHIAYIPAGKVIGVSKLARLTDCFARRLQIQEKMTGQIADAIDRYLHPKAVAVIIEATHQCMRCRGVNKQDAVMVTSEMRGAFRNDIAARNEVLALIKK